MSMLNANVGCQYGATNGLHMAGQAAYGCPGDPYGCPWGPYGCSEAAFGCRGVAFWSTGAVYGSHAADMQHMLHLAGPGWAARIQTTWPGDGSQGAMRD